MVGHIQLSNHDDDMDPVRRAARAIMLTARRHEKMRHRQYAEPPHGWGCDLGCFPPGPHLGDALTLALHVGGIVLTPDHRYAPGWMRPA